MADEVSGLSNLTRAIDLTDVNVRNAFILGLSLNGIPVPVKVAGANGLVGYSKWTEYIQYIEKIDGFRTHKIELRQVRWTNMEVIEP